MYKINSGLWLVSLSDNTFCSHANPSVTIHWNCCQYHILLSLSYQDSSWKEKLTWNIYNPQQWKQHWLNESCWCEPLWWLVGCTICHTAFCHLHHMLHNVSLIIIIIASFFQCVNCLLNHYKNNYWNAQSCICRTDKSHVHAYGQFHVTTDTTQKNKSSYSEYLVIVLYSTHITCHGFKGNIQI